MDNDKIKIFGVLDLIHQGYALNKKGDRKFSADRLKEANFTLSDILTDMGESVMLPDEFMNILDEYIEMKNLDSRIKGVLNNAFSSLMTYCYMEKSLEVIGGELSDKEV